MIDFIKQNRFLSFILTLDIVGILLLFVYDSYAYIDEFEHLKISYLVGLGYVPYRDFIEHHHPLLWYAFAPLIKILPHNAMLALYVAKTLTLATSVFTFYIIYLILKLFIGSVVPYVYYLAAAFTFFPIWYGFSLFKPEAFARLFYFAGIYYFFCYAENKKIKQLIFSGVLFCIAFFFIQTAIFNILPLAIPLYVLCHSERKCLFDALISFAICFGVLIFVVSVLYFTDVLPAYFQLNWILNLHIFDFINSNDHSVIWFWLIPYAMAIGSGIYFIRRQSSFYFNTLLLLLICSFIQHIYFVAYYPHYLILLSIFAAIFLAIIIKELNYTVYRNLMYTCLLGFTAVNYLIFAAHLTDVRFDLIKETNQKANQVINFSYNTLSLYAPPTSFYILYNNLHCYDDMLFKRFPEYDVNTFILNTRPQYINVGKNLQNSYSERFSLNPAILQQHYQKISPLLYKLKN